ncbi:MAG: M14-type cytosolic carboxypeptidase [Planctomycetaceae bacterium]
MKSFLTPAVLSVVFIVPPVDVCLSAEPLTVLSDFEGASVAEVKIDQVARSVSFMPGGDPERGWPCWWYFRINGVTPGETITLRLRGSTASHVQKKPLAASWAMPKQATWSADGKMWLRTEEGQADGDSIVYTFLPHSTSAFVAWGPPYTPRMAADFVRDISNASPHAEAAELCRSREGRSVPMLRVREGDRTEQQRFGVWIQARQHAWESGSSWVAQGFAEWLVSDSADAAWLRQHAGPHPCHSCHGCRQRRHRKWWQRCTASRSQP